MINGKVELNRIDNLDTVAVSLKLAIRVLYIVSSSKVDEGRNNAVLRRRNLPISTGVEQHLTDKNVDNVLIHRELQLCLQSNEMVINSRLEGVNTFEEQLLLLQADLIILPPFLCMLDLHVCLHLVRSKQCEEVGVVHNLEICTNFAFTYKRNTEATLDRGNLLC